MKKLIEEIPEDLTKKTAVERSSKPQPGVTVGLNTETAPPLASKTYRHNECVKKNADNSNELPQTGDTELDMVFKELCDPLVPVRGHGLIRLTKLVHNRDKCIRSRESAILKIFEENLDHGDSYIYLSAISGLSAMCDVYPDLTVPRVCQLFADFEGTREDNSVKTKSPELRMKLGEIMVKAARTLGE